MWEGFSTKKDVQSRWEGFPTMVDFQFRREGFPTKKDVQFQWEGFPTTKVVQSRREGFPCVKDFLVERTFLWVTNCTVGGISRWEGRKDFPLRWMSNHGGMDSSMKRIPQ